MYRKGDMEMGKQTAWEEIDKKSSEIFTASDEIWGCAETAFTEEKSMKILCDVLKAEGFTVETGLAGVTTAFKGTFGSGKPVIGILGEFDALSGLDQEAGATEKIVVHDGASGHGCGHNMLGTASLSAAIGIKKYLEESGKPGTVIYFGCPGEEGGSGKAFMAKGGVFANLDAAITWHPGDLTQADTGSSLANYQVAYKFYGKSAHAGGAPHLGRSALDALELMNMGVQFLREHVVPEARIHYAITNTGGYSPNVVQPYAEVLYLIRAPNNSQVEDISPRVNKIAEGAAHMTETRVEIDFVKGCSNLMSNKVIAKELWDNLVELGAPEYTEEEMKFAKAISDGITNASHTDGILLWSLETVEPTGKVSQHLLMIRKSMSCITEAPAMTAGWINMHGTLVALVSHRRIISHTIGYRWNHLIITRHQDDGTRSEMATDSLVVRPFLHQLRIGLALLTQEVDAGTLMGDALIHRNHRIEEDGEVRTYIIFSMGTYRRSQMAASREAHDTHILLINMPDSSTVTNRAHSLISIAQGNITVALRHTILQNKESNTLPVEIFCPLMSLMIHCKMRIATSRTIYYSSS